MFAGFKDELTMRDKFHGLHWGLVLCIVLIGAIGYMGLYSAANGNVEPYAGRHLMRFVIGLSGFFITAFIDIRVWRSLAYPLYWFTLILLIIVELKGYVGMGAQRWIDFGLIKFQPSELMKIALVLVLARIFDKKDPETISHPFHLWWPILLVVVPVGLVMMQPDLGTALILIAIGGVMLFLSGVSWYLFGGAVVAICAAIPIAWKYFLIEYQRQRVRIFLNPEIDPLGAGYHVTQSKIALGSGGMWGKGFLEGTQSHLNFLPEKQTDFIFTLLSEEWGLFGGLIILTLYFVCFGYGLLISQTARSDFARLIAMGIVMNVMFYVIINVGMVMGLLPVVGVPLPMISYGGTSMLTVLFGFGLMQSASTHRNLRMSSLF